MAGYVQEGYQRVIMDLREDLLLKLAEEAGITEEDFFYDKSDAIEKIKLSLYDRYDLRRPLTREQKARLKSYKRRAKKIEEDRDEIAELEALQ